MTIPPIRATVKKDVDVLPAFTHDPAPTLAAYLGAIASGVGAFMASWVGLADVDLEAGRGRVSETALCFWRRDGRRITIDVGSGFVVASVSEHPDPSYPGGA